METHAHSISIYLVRARSWWIARFSILLAILFRLRNFTKKSFFLKETFVFILFNKIVTKKLQKRSIKHSSS